MGGKPDTGIGGQNPLQPFQEQLNTLARRVGDLERGLVREDAPQPVTGLLNWYTFNPGTGGQLVSALQLTRTAAPAWVDLWSGYRRQLRHNAIRFDFNLYSPDGSTTATVRLLVNGEEVWTASTTTQVIDSTAVLVDGLIGSAVTLLWQGQHDGTDGVDEMAVQISNVTWVDSALVGLS